MLRIEAVPKSRAELDAAANPVNARQPEAVPDVLYDTQDVANANPTRIPFFTNVNADRTRSNMDAAGQIPADVYFEIVAINLDLLAKPSLAADGLAGPANDLAEILYTQRAVFVLSFSQKEQLRIPATYLHQSGGPIPYLTGAAGAGGVSQYALNSIQDGGFYIGKRIILTPKQSFSAVIELAGAPALAATRTLRLSFAGVRHRRVL